MDKPIIRGQPLVGFAIALVIVGSAWALLTLYEFVALDLYPVREEPAVFTAYFLARSVFALLVSTALIGILHRHPSADSTLNTSQLGSSANRIAEGAMIGAFGGAALLFVSPETFMNMTQEDTFIEWASALLLFVGSGCFFVEAFRRLASVSSGGWIAKSEFVIVVGLALLLFLIAMEEISWGQRLFGFETPEDIQNINWQGEFNFHNLQTDLSETLYYTGTGFFLVIFPLLRETVARGSDWFNRLLDFAPSRGVVAVSAPTAIFNYGHWNLIPIQVTAFCAMFVMLAYAVAAKKRSDRREYSLFLFLTVGIVIGQGIFLTYGQRMPEVGNATEFKELFIAIGLCWYGIDRLQSWRAIAPNAHQQRSNEAVQ